MPQAAPRANAESPDSPSVTGYCAFSPLIAARCSSAAKCSASNLATIMIARTVRPENAFAFRTPALAIRKNCWTPKPNVIGEIAVLTQDSMVRS